MTDNNIEVVNIDVARPAPKTMPAIIEAPVKTADDQPLELVNLVP